jgi:hypothetical protein
MSVVRKRGREDARNYGDHAPTSLPFTGSAKQVHLARRRKFYSTMYFSEVTSPS